MASKQHQISKLSLGGMLVTLGIVYGDIGTSPLYALKAIVADKIISADLVLGGVSLVFWTLTLITTLKYIRLALEIDNNGEGGIFALYAMVRRKNLNWLIYLAIIGCATLMADGFLTPSISISSAVEGLNLLRPNIETVPIVIGILVVLFVFQQFGTNIIGKTFGPVMLLWFGTMGTYGLLQIIQHPMILKAANPYYGIHLLMNYPKGFLILGGVFLCTTGAEALYSDLGHCGKMNIRVSWIFVKITLLLSYFGQGAYLLSGNMGKLWTKDLQLFYLISPKFLLPYTIVIASLAAIIASQALITGSFTMINEAMKLRLMPLLKVNYPTQLKGQIYIPFVNWLLLAGCILVVFIFRESSNMEAAYGLTITVNLLMTTTLMVIFYYYNKIKLLYIVIFGIIFFTIEGAFFLSNIDKFAHGGWFSFCIAAFFIFLMYIQLKARALRKKHIAFVNVNEYKDKLEALINDDSIQKEATNLVFMSMSDKKEMLDSNIVYSIFRKKPKRADVYWFVHMEIVDDPYEKNYSVNTIIPQKCFFITVRFGFKVEHKINLVMNHVVQEMVERGEVDNITRYPSLRKYNMVGDFKYYLINSRVSVDDKITPVEQFIIRTYRLIKSISLPPEKDFGLEVSNVVVETVPINIGLRVQDMVKGFHRVK